jgi:hypothetical protein
MMAMMRNQFMRVMSCTILPMAPGSTLQAPRFPTPDSSRVCTNQFHMELLRARYPRELVDVWGA